MTSSVMQGYVVMSSTSVSNNHLCVKHILHVNVFVCFLICFHVIYVSSDQWKVTKYVHDVIIMHIIINGTHCSLGCGPIHCYYYCKDVLGNLAIRVAYSSQLSFILFCCYYIMCVHMYKTSKTLMPTISFPIFSPLVYVIFKYKA